MDSGPVLSANPFPQALESLNKKDIGEIKSYGRPPAQVEMVMQAVMILRGNEPTWAEAKRQLGKQRALLEETFICLVFIDQV